MGATYRIPKMAYVLFEAQEFDDLPTTATTFTSEDEARSAFTRLTSSASKRMRWAELVCIAAGPPSILAWSGRPSPRFTNDRLSAWLSCTHRT